MQHRESFCHMCTATGGNGSDVPENAKVLLIHLILKHATTFTLFTQGYFKKSTKYPERRKNLNLNLILSDTRVKSFTISYNTVLKAYSFKKVNILTRVPL